VELAFAAIAVESVKVSLGNTSSTLWVGCGNLALRFMGKAQSRILENLM
jgi:hypothetical protein